MLRLTDEAVRARYPVQHVDRASLGLVYAVANIDRNTRHDPSLCSRPFPGNRPVNVPTEQSGDLSMPRHDVFKGLCFFRMAVAPDVMIADIERRMMNE